MSKFLTSVVSVAMAFGLVAPASAVTIYEDDFESYDISGGPIDVVGQTAPTGQTYIAAPGSLAGVGGTLTSMQVRDDIGVPGGQGAGATAAGITGVTIDLGVTYSTGTYTLAMDYRVANRAEPQWFLGNSAGFNNLSLTLEPQAGQSNPTTGLAFQGSAGGAGFGNHTIPQPPDPPAAFTGPSVLARLVTTFDLDADMVTVTWQGLDEVNAGVSGSYTVAIPNPDYSFSHLHLYNGSRVGPHGFDNIILLEGALEPTLDGDLNTDGFVGQDDLNIILAEWGAMPPTDNRADPSGDGFVGQDDLNPVLEDWGQGTPPGVVSAVPEPNAILLMVIGGLVAVALRRGRRSRR